MPDLIKLYHQTNTQRNIKARRIRLEGKHPSGPSPSGGLNSLPLHTVARLCSLTTQSSSAVTTACLLPPKSAGPTTINSPAFIADTFTVPSAHARSTTKTPSRPISSISILPIQRQGNDSSRRRRQPHHFVKRACTTPIPLSSAVPAVALPRPYPVTSTSTESSASYLDAIIAPSVRKHSHPAAIMSDISVTSMSFTLPLYIGSSRWSSLTNPLVTTTGPRCKSTTSRSCGSTSFQENPFDTSSSAFPTTSHQTTPMNISASASSITVHSTTEQSARSNVRGRPFLEEG
jgi:hypothetical protein